MNKTTYVIETRKNADGTISSKNGVIYTPKAQFGGGEIKWYQDKLKSST